MVGRNLYNHNKYLLTYKINGLVRSKAVNMRCVAPIRRKATETEGLVHCNANCYSVE